MFIMKRIVRQGLLLMFMIPTVVFAWPSDYVPGPERNTNEITFDFSVHVKEPTCTVLLGPGFTEGNKTIELGSIKNEKDAKGPLVPVRIRFVKCNSYNRVSSIIYEKDIAKPDPNAVNDGYVSTTLDHVRVQLYSDSSGLTSLPKTGWQGKKPIQNQQTNEIIPFYARAEVLESGKRADKFKAQASFLVTYE